MQRSAVAAAGVPTRYGPSLAVSDVRNVLTIHLDDPSGESAKLPLMASFAKEATRPTLLGRSCWIM